MHVDVEMNMTTNAKSLIELIVAWTLIKICLMQPLICVFVQWILLDFTFNIPLLVQEYT